MLSSLVLLNSSLFSSLGTRSDLTFLQVPTLQLAQEAGSERTANMVMVGALCAKSGLLSLQEALAGMEAALKGKEKFFDMNRKGIERGFSFIQKG